MQRYYDRQEAGKILANELASYTNNPNVIVLALPRGGVPVAYEIAKKLNVTLDVFIVRKLGLPEHEEFAMGAIAVDGTVVFNDEAVKNLNIPKSVIEQVIQIEEQELERRNILYRGNRPFPIITGKTIILVDDGLATGATMHAAIKALQKHHPVQIIVAVPVAASDSFRKISTLVNKVICPFIPDNFYGVGLWYVNFPQTTDTEVHELLVNISKNK